ncbi:hypothetical protein [Bartonella birtlesii]|uniref:hypothetical protein n=1 Tax=Bartonella birtlesii TaxID=111504 RepID=UPI0012DFBEE9|nr:hypothetical protein [Bartonella birtlesii]
MVAFLGAVLGLCVGVCERIAGVYAGGCVRGYGGMCGVSFVDFLLERMGILLHV